MELILASNNTGKLQEMRTILSVMGHEVRSQREAGLELDVAETGTTFSANARLKAEAVVNVTGKAAIADDSGLVVAALGGAPGIYSARYGGDLCKSDEERYRYLLREMDGIEERDAHFVCSIVCLFPDGREIEAEGCWRGKIRTAPQGDNGFGYDPVFYIPELEKTAAELPSDVKNQISHRAKALQEFKAKLQMLL